MKKTFGKINIKITGTTFEGRQGKLWMLRKHEDGAYLTLRRDKKNTFDENAIRVIAHAPGCRACCIGYVPKETSSWLHKCLDEKKIVRCNHIKDNGKNMPFVTGKGKQNKHLGCQLSIAYELTDDMLAK